jgi:hypothetical protein
MSMLILRQVREAIANVDPDSVREAAERPLTVRITALSSAGYAEIEDFLAPGTISRRKRLEVSQFLFRDGDAGVPATVDLDIVEADVDPPEGAFVFDPNRPGDLVTSVIAARDDLGLALARSFPPFRRPVIDRAIHSIARENTVFTLMTSLPHIAPNLTLPFDLSDSISDTAFHTVNQIRLAFLLGAASDRLVGYREQKAEIATIIMSAFGWRAFARKLGEWLRFGSGIVPKAALAYAGTYLLGRSLERLYRTGYGLTRDERQLTYGDALAKGRQVASAILTSWRERSGDIGAAQAPASSD